METQKYLQHPDTGDIDTYENWLAEMKTWDDYSDEGALSPQEQFDTLLEVEGEVEEFCGSYRLKNA